MQRNFQTENRQQNTDFYAGYEGEGEIKVMLAGCEDTALHIWDGYFNDLFGGPRIGRDWIGFAKDYNEGTRTFSSGPVIRVRDLPEYASDLRRRESSEFSYPETKDVLLALQDMFRQAISQSIEIEVRVF
jgi:hypothetical protein